jgi:hypothetical protein
MTAQTTVRPKQRQARTPCAVRECGHGCVVEGKNSYRTHTGNQAKQALGMAWHGLAALWHGWTGKARRANCEVRDFQTGARRWRSSRGVVQSLSGAPARMGSWEGKGWMGREGKNYDY